MADEDLVVCRVCGEGWQGASPGERCPTGDGGALVALETDRAHPTDDLLGRVVAGRYPVIGVLGSGGFGSVYRAIQEPVGRLVALKVIDPDVDDPALPARFMDEARAVAGLSDPSVVTLHDYGEDADGRLYMVFELVEGTLLAEARRQLGGVMGAERVVALTLQLLAGLAEAHGCGIVHRDLKPENIMLTRGGLGEEKVKILDFGIATVMGEDDAGHTNVALGTPRYMSPEQARGEAVDGRSDLYSLGVMLYELLAGRPPFEGATPLDTLRAHIDAPPPPLPSTVPANLRGAVERALEKRPEARFSDAEGMARALRGVAEPGFYEPPPTTILSTDGLESRSPTRAPAEPSAAPAAEAPPVAVNTPAWVRPRRRRLDPRLIVGAAAAAVVVVLIAWAVSGPAPRPADEAPVTLSVGSARPAVLDRVVDLVRAGRPAEARATLKAALESAPDRLSLARQAGYVPELNALMKDPALAPLLEP